MNRLKKGLGLLIASLCVTSMNGNAIDFPAAPLRLDLIRENNVLPVFVIPKKDGEVYGNKIEAVFVSDDQDRTEITVVFSDESHPNRIVDKLYRTYRYFRHGRTKDVESFYLKYSIPALNQCEIPDSIEFPGSYSAAQQWNRFFQHHYHHETVLQEFQTLAGRPIIYINTWNHLFSEQDTNAKISLDDTLLVLDYPMYIGSRKDVEKIIKGHTFQF